jgi:hypothetical protein
MSYNNNSEANSRTSLNLVVIQKQYLLNKLLKFNIILNYCK